MNEQNLQTELNQSNSLLVRKYIIFVEKKVKLGALYSLEKNDGQDRLDLRKWFIHIQIVPFLYLSIEKRKNYYRKLNCQFGEHWVLCQYPDNDAETFEFLTVVDVEGDQSVLQKGEIEERSDFRFLAKKYKFILAGEIDKSRKIRNSMVTSLVISY